MPGLAWIALVTLGRRWSDGWRRGSRGRSPRDGPLPGEESYAIAYRPYQPVHPALASRQPFRHGSGRHPGHLPFGTPSAIRVCHDDSGIGERRRVPGNATGTNRRGVGDRWRWRRRHDGHGHPAFGFRSHGIRANRRRWQHGDLRRGRRSSALVQRAARVEASRRGPRHLPHRARDHQPARRRSRVAGSRAPDAATLALDPPGAADQSLSPCPGSERLASIEYSRRRVMPSRRAAGGLFPPAFSMAP